MPEGVCITNKIIKTILVSFFFSLTACGLSGFEINAVDVESIATSDSGNDAAPAIMPTLASDSDSAADPDFNSELDSGPDSELDSEPDIIPDINPSPVPAREIEYGLQDNPDPHPNYAGKTYVVNNLSSLSVANSKAQPGDIIEIANGTYSSSIFKITRSGTAAKKIIVKPKSPKGVTFTGDGSLWLVADHLWVEEFRFVKVKSYSLVVLNSDIRITRNYFEGNGTEGEETVRIFGKCNRVEIDNNEITKSVRQSIVPYSPIPGNPNYLKTQAHNIHHNYFHNFPRTISNGGEILTPIFGAKVSIDEQRKQNFGNRFEYNHIEDFHNDAEILSIKNGGWIIRYNLLTNNSGYLSLRTSNNSVIDSNIFIKSNGIRIAGQNHKITNNYIDGSGAGILMHDGYNAANGSPEYQVAQKNLIANNTIRTSGRPIAMLVKGAPLVLVAKTNNNTFINNVFWRTTSGSWYDYDIVSNNIWRHNLIFNSTQSYSGGDIPSGVGNENTNPQLTLVDGIYEPSSTQSAVVDSGERKVTSVDMHANPRDGSPDIGAIEFQK